MGKKKQTLSEEDRIHLDKALADIEGRILLKKVIMRCEPVADLWNQRLYLGQVVTDCAAVFQRYQLELDAEGMTDEDREGVERINAAFNTIRHVALELQ